MNEKSKSSAALEQQRALQAAPDNSCPDCRVQPGQEHTLQCGARDSGQVIWPGWPWNEDVDGSLWEPAGFCPDWGRASCGSDDRA